MLNRKKRLLSSRSDGWAYVYAVKDGQGPYGSRKNVDSLEDLDFVAKLAFEECSRREQDYEFAQRVGFGLSLKLRTHAHPGVDVSCRVRIGKTLHVIEHMDRAGSEMYLYLGGGKEIEC